MRLPPPAPWPAGWWGSLHHLRQWLAGNGTTNFKPFLRRSAGEIAAWTWTSGEREVAGEGGPRRRGAAAPPPAILWDQAQLDFLETSQTLARLLDKNLRAQVAEEGRGVFGLPILLLRWLRMPAVLLDIGALSGPGFEAKLRDDAYLQRAHCQPRRNDQVLHQGIAMRRSGQVSGRSQGEPLGLDCHRDLLASVERYGGCWGYLGRVVRH
jgi:hypothetical protein